MFDTTEARKAIARVKERSIGPETVHDLSALLAAATARVETLQGDVQNSASTLATEREQIKNKLAQADRDVLSAIQARDAAIDTERQHGEIVRLAVALEQAVTRIEDSTEEVAWHKAEWLKAQADADAALAAAAQTQATITAERDAAIASDAAHQATLARIADLSWWERLSAVGMARGAQ